MLMVIPDVGKVRVSQWAWQTENASFGDLEVVLYTSNTTPGNASVYGDFTQATFTGSAPITIQRADWTGPTLIANVAYVTDPVPPQWDCTAGGPETCYGWILYDLADNTLIAAQRFDAPRVMNVGASEVLDPFRIAMQTLH